MYHRQQQQPSSSCWEYQVFSDYYPHPEQGSYRSYGILGYRHSQQSRMLVAVLGDISPQQAAVTQLAQQLTSCQLSPVHLSDVVTDFLMDKLTLCWQAPKIAERQ